MYDVLLTMNRKVNISNVEAKQILHPEQAYITDMGPLQVNHSTHHRETPIQSRVHRNHQLTLVQDDPWFAVWVSGVEQADLSVVQVKAELQSLVIFQFVKVLVSWGNRFRYQNESIWTFVLNNTFQFFLVARWLKHLLSLK